MEYTAQKEVAGKFATLVWIGSGLYLYLTTHGPSLFSWSALGFFVAGMFAATIIFGMAFYLVKRGIARVLTIALGAPTQRIAQLIRALGGVLFIVEIVVIFLAASWVFHQIESPQAPFPPPYVTDRDNLNAAMKAFAEANKLDRENMAGRDRVPVVPEVEAKFLALVETGLERGKKVSDGFLAWLDPDLPQHYRRQLILGHELLLQGRRQGNIVLQGTGIELVRRFYQDFLPNRGEAILKKLE